MQLFVLCDPRAVFPQGRRHHPRPLRRLFRICDGHLRPSTTIVLRVFRPLLQELQTESCYAHTTGLRCVAYHEAGLLSAVRANNAQSSPMAIIITAAVQMHTTGRHATTCPTFSLA